MVIAIGDHMLRSLEKRALRGHIESAAAGKTNLTNEQLVDLLRSTFPQSYSRHDRKLLTDRVADITPLSCRRDDTIDERAPVTKKRRKIDETPKVSSQVEVLSSSVPATMSEKDGRQLDLSESDVRKEMNSHGAGGWRDASGNDRPMFRDLGGMDEVIRKLKMDVIAPLHQLKLMRHLGVEPKSRVLLHGPPGCGKTTLARAIANETGLPFYELNVAELMSEVSGAPEESIREIFTTAYMSSPSIVFIDEIDAMTSKGKSLWKDIETHIVNQLKACMDEPYRFIKPVNQNAGSENANIRPGYVLVIGATSRHDAVDLALRRRFDHEIVIGAPDIDARYLILSTLTPNLKVEVGFDPATIARCTLGFVGGDLVKLVKMAGTCAVNRIMAWRYDEIYKEQRGRVQFEDCYRQPFSEEEMENVSITTADFLKSAETIQPSSKLEDFCTVPNAKWDDVGGLQKIKLEFERHIIKPIKFPEFYKDLGASLKTNFILLGPSNCGKTLIVEALANEAGANFMHIKGSELLRDYDDQYELVVRIIFNYAGLVLHLEYTVPSDMIGLRWRVLGWLARERMPGVYVIGALNRSEEGLHHLLIFMNKFDKFLSLPLPSPEERGAILKTLARNKPIDANVDLMALGKDVACENFNGADLSNLMKEAAKAAFDRPTLSGEGCSSLPWIIKDEDFKSALKKISASVSSKQIKK